MGRAMNAEERDTARDRTAATWTELRTRWTVLNVQVSGDDGDAGSITVLVLGAIV